MKTQATQTLSDPLGDLASTRVVEAVRPLAQGDALLLWGKAARALAWSMWRRGMLVDSRHFSLAIGTGPGARDFPTGMRTVWGEHPIPGAGSLEAGQALMDFIGSLPRLGVKRLRVVLSGGASSAAWLPPAGLFMEKGRSEFERLYRAGLSIRDLNRERALLCLLKNGGARRALRSFAPHVGLLVEVVSDVLPWGPEVVGSGPFWDPARSAESVRNHCVIADNRLWLDQVARRWDAQVSRSGWVASQESWIEALCVAAHAPPGISLFGGEALIKVPERSGRGGRLTHLAARFLEREAEQLESGWVEALFLASDGVDGRSGLGGVRLGRDEGRWAMSHRAALRSAIRRYQTARLFPPHRGGQVARASGSNVQDLVAIQVTA